MSQEDLHELPQVMAEDLMMDLPFKQRHSGASPLVLKDLDGHLHLCMDIWDGDREANWVCGSSSPKKG